MAARKEELTVVFFLFTCGFEDLRVEDGAFPCCQNTLGPAKRSLNHDFEGVTNSGASPDIPSKYREVGQPVIVPGDMGTCSYVLSGTEGAMAQTFGSTCHGAGRALGRKAALKKFGSRNLIKELWEKQ